MRPPVLAQLAATAWRLQFAEHWAAEHGGKAGDELRLAVARLRCMLGDEDEIRWRSRGLHGLVRSRVVSLVLPGRAHVRCSLKD